MNNPELLKKIEEALLQNRNDVYTNTVTNFFNNFFDKILSVGNITEDSNADNVNKVLELKDNIFKTFIQRLLTKYPYPVNTTESDEVTDILKNIVRIVDNDNLQKRERLNKMVECYDAENDYENQKTLLENINTYLSTLPTSLTRQFQDSVENLMEFATTSINGIKMEVEKIYRIKYDNAKLEQGYLSELQNSLIDLKDISVINNESLVSSVENLEEITNEKYKSSWDIKLQDDMKLDISEEALKRISSLENNDIFVSMEKVILKLTKDTGVFLSDNAMANFLAKEDFAKLVKSEDEAIINKILQLSMFEFLNIDVKLNEKLSYEELKVLNDNKLKNNIYTLNHLFSGKNLSNNVKILINEKLGVFTDKINNSVDEKERMSNLLFKAKESFSNVFETINELKPNFLYSKETLSSETLGFVFNMDLGGVGKSKSVENGNSSEDYDFYRDFDNLENDVIDTTSEENTNDVTENGTTKIKLDVVFDNVLKNIFKDDLEEFISAVLKYDLNILTNTVMNTVRSSEDLNYMINKVKNKYEVYKVRINNDTNEDIKKIALEKLERITPIIDNIIGKLENDVANKVKTLENMKIMGENLESINFENDIEKITQGFVIENIFGMNNLKPYNKEQSLIKEAVRDIFQTNNIKHCLRVALKKNLQSENLKLYNEIVSRKNTIEKSLEQTMNQIKDVSEIAYEHLSFKKFSVLDEMKNFNTLENINFECCKNLYNNILKENIDKYKEMVSGENISKENSLKKLVIESIESNPYVKNNEFSAENVIELYNVSDKTLENFSKQFINKLTFQLVKSDENFATNSNNEIYIDQMKDKVELITKFMIVGTTMKLFDDSDLVDICKKFNVDSKTF